MKKVLKILWKIIKIYLLADMVLYAYIGGGDYLWRTKRNDDHPTLGIAESITTATKKYKKVFSN